MTTTIFIDIGACQSRCRVDRSMRPAFSILDLATLRPGAAAEEALIDPRIVMADPDAYQGFLTRLDSTPSPNAALRKTMQTPALWEQKNDFRP